MPSVPCVLSHKIPRPFSIFHCQICQQNFSKIKNTHSDVASPAFTFFLHITLNFFVRFFYYPPNLSHFSLSLSVFIFISCFSGFGFCFFFLFNLIFLFRFRLFVSFISRESDGGICFWFLGKSRGAFCFLS